MAKEVYMPALGMNQETGTLLRWLKAEGEPVQQGEPLMEVATDKTDVEIEAPASGILRAVTAAEGEEVPVGKVIALIAAPDEVIAAPPAPAVAPPASAEQAAPARPIPIMPPRQPAAQQSAARRGEPSISPLAARIAAEHGVDLAAVTPTGSRIQKEDVLAYLAAQSTPPGGRVPASPKARRLAAEAGVDLAAIAGSGPDGAVLAADVAAAAAPVTQAQTAAPVQAVMGAAVTGESVPISRMWRVMADRLAESWATVPHFFLAREVDAGALMTWREAAQARSDAKITYTDLLVKVVAGALRRHPRLNASWQNNGITANAEVHIGIAVAVDDGLLVPVIRYADRIGLGEIAAARADLVARAQAGKLTPADLQGGTFTISNLGMFGVDHFSAIVNPPQAAILAVGRILEKVVPVNGQPGVRPMLGLNLSADHRVADGARAARFLESVAAAIEDPLRLLD
ncbi:MAG: 2-oxo acid dehydrogenase subunit E2 [Caldilineaceae bacterium]|nr:2-oxo acid dehydrogenase subunit E2 [Caldilineaceae bacterium]